MLIRKAVLLVVLLALSTSAGAREVRFPVRFDDELMRRHLIAQAFTDARETAHVWDDGSGCNYMVLSDPQVHAADGLVSVRSRGLARVGTLIGERCLAVLNWSGFVEAFEKPVLSTTAGVVEFQVTDSRLYDESGEKAGVIGTLWNRVKQHLHVRLERSSLDLNYALEEIKALLPLLVPKDRQQAREALESVVLTEIRAAAGQLEFMVKVDLPEQLIAPPAAPAPEPALTRGELQRWAQTWHDWDAFLTLVIRRAAVEAAPELRADLLAVLLDARWDIFEILASPPARGIDPVRVLFLETWSRLAPVLRRESSGLQTDSALRWLSFVAAADVLQAIDEAMPDLGVTLSADALRRMARIVLPDAPPDPLQYGEEVDPELRRALGFGPPLPPPRPKPDVSLKFPFFFKSAMAADANEALGKRLDGWVPTIDTLDDYLPLVAKLLDNAAHDALSEGQLPADYREMFTPLVRTTAWQESCWRQYVVKGDKYVPISSGTGSVGIMQVNQYVWRGFYDINGLNWDIGYNARAGAEILHHYLTDYAIARGEHTETGDARNLARAAYAMYNGGPGHMKRYRADDTADSLRAIDEAFWKKYQAMVTGDEGAVAGCYAEGI